AAAIMARLPSATGLRSDRGKAGIRSLTRWIPMWCTTPDRVAASSGFPRPRARSGTSLLRRFRKAASTASTGRFRWHFLRKIPRSVLRHAVSNEDDERGDELGRNQPGPDADPSGRERLEKKAGHNSDDCAFNGERRSDLGWHTRREYPA